MASGCVPSDAGLGLRAPHLREIEARRPNLGFLEVHPENYMGAGGPPHRHLEALRETYPLSFHGVGLSLMSAEALDAAHLARLKALIARYRPGLVSEHLAWCAQGGRFFNDLLPVPLNDETLGIAAAQVTCAQEALGVRLLIENPSLYGKPAGSDIPEPEFLSALAEKTGCGLLLDVNNVFVCASNLGFSAEDYIDAFAAGHVGEIHLAGHACEDVAGRTLRIDDHGADIDAAVWALYARTLARTGPVPVLIERDSHIPPLDTLLAEVARAQTCLNNLTRPIWARTQEATCPPSPHSKAASLTL